MFCRYYDNKNHLLLFKDYTIIIIKTIIIKRLKMFSFFKFAVSFFKKIAIKLVRKKIEKTLKKPMQIMKISKTIINIAKNKNKSPNEIFIALVDNFIKTNISSFVQTKFRLLV